MRSLEEARAVGRLGSLLAVVMTVLGFLVLVWSAIAEPIR